MSWIFVELPVDLFIFERFVETQSNTSMWTPAAMGCFKDHKIV